MEFVYEKDPPRITSERPIAVIYPNGSLFLSGDYGLDEVIEIVKAAEKFLALGEQKASEYYAVK